MCSLITTNVTNYLYMTYLCLLLEYFTLLYSLYTWYTSYVRAYILVYARRRARARVCASSVALVCVPVRVYFIKSISHSPILFICCLSLFQLHPNIIYIYSICLFLFLVWPILYIIAARLYRILSYFIYIYIYFHSLQYQFPIIDK